MSLLQNSNAISTGGDYNLESSLRFRSSASAYLKTTFASAGNRRTWTWSGWVKRGSLTGNQALFTAETSTAGSGTYSLIRFVAGQLIYFDYTNGTTNHQSVCTGQFRDPSAWYHIVVAVDTTQATGSDRCKIYVNGVQQSTTSSNTFTQNYQGQVNNALLHYIGTAQIGTSNQYFDGYITEVNFVDGQALTPSTFGSYDGTTGVWKPKEYTGTYGTNGFYLPMKETQQATGFNTVLYTGTGATQSISNVGFSPDLVWIKNRNQTGSAHILQDTIRGAGKSLFSHLTNAESGNSGDLISSFDADGFTVNTNYLGGTDNSTNKSGDGNVAWCWDAGNDNTTGSELITNGTFDTDTSSWTAVDGTLSASGQKLTVTRTGATFGAAYQAIATTSGKMYAVKFDTEYVAGNGNFVLVGTSPSNADLGTFGPYTTNSINNVVTFIATGSTTYIRLLADTLIGVTAIWDNISVKEVTQDGTIPSYYKANPATGFSIVSFVGNGSAGATVGHGLGSAPKFIMGKNRTDVQSWRGWHTGLTDASYYIDLDSTNGQTSNSGAWNSTAPDSSVVTLGTMNGTNGTSDNMILYCFSEVAGFSKFGSYTGTGSSGNTITTGFRPAFVLIKRTDSANEWFIHDNTRDPDNPTTQTLYANSSSTEVTETTANTWNTLDDGFELLGTTGGSNASGGTYIYMAFADTRDAQFNFDASGNKNNWTANNINSNASSETTYDIMNDVPTLTDEDTANFATLNPAIRPYTVYPAEIISNSNLTLTCSSNAVSGSAWSTMVLTTGKWYFESTITSVGGFAGLGFSNNTLAVGLGTFNADARFWGCFYQNNGQKAINNTLTAYGATFTTGDVIGAALDADAGTVTFYKNGVSQGAITGLSVATGSAGWIADVEGFNGAVHNVNFGQRPFAYTPPTGYKKLNTYNLPDSTIKDGSKYMNTVLYTGNGSTQSITGVGFSPDLVWVKNRNSTQDHSVYDTVRGISRRIYTNGTFAEDYNVGNGITSFDSDGWTTGSLAGVNTNSNTYVAWNWKGGESTVENTDGSITSQVSANPTSGFSVVTYTATGNGNDTVGHGLGTAPKVVLLKSRSTGDWAYYTTQIDGSLDYLYLNLTASKGDSGWTAPSSTVFPPSNASNGTTMVAYCFAEVEGFSKFGKFTGNGSADGTFVYTGFRPAFVLTKSATEARNWVIIDTTRDPNNLADQNLEPNTTNAEFTNADDMDILSNGFKMRTANPGANGNGQTIIYMAFAETPMKFANAR